MQRVLVNDKADRGFRESSVLSKTKLLQSNLLELKALIDNGKATDLEFKSYRVSLKTLESIDPFYKKTKFYKELMELKWDNQNLELG